MCGKRSKERCPTQASCVEKGARWGVLHMHRVWRKEQGEESYTGIVWKNPTRRKMHLGKKIHVWERNVIRINSHIYVRKKQKLNASKNDSHMWVSDKCLLIAIVLAGVSRDTCCTEKSQMTHIEGTRDIQMIHMALQWIKWFYRPSFCWKCNPTICPEGYY